ncbi:MATE efflux family protein [Hyphopichia burtonii NRRL Y-1933]|uniref:MATE efflux family protein n=1 Tax=Hyphopichia burtonii NRRL Y-1933 TaxID=984485 RepID=A0A1E4RN13_9ASCO|nr:MATE efflux family protein [Hyphopichia burtonii NRRL Y-1933]ODV68626.1 MATE efflux family protein [Hyphopichia burtonii NRRL Y-1933]
MSSTDKSHQFTHSNSERRASTVYGSVGKQGLFLPSDFIRSPKNSAIDADDNEPLAYAGSNASAFAATETAPLLGSSAGTSNLKVRRKSSISRELIEQERELLKDNKIPIAHDDDDDEVAETFENAVSSHKISSTTASIELKSLVKSSIPLVLTFLLQNSLSTVSVFTVGHLGAVELAAVSMGAMTANITGYATIQGIATALDTLCPQAFGAKNYRLVGVYLQKCTALIFVIMLPILITWLFFGYRLITLILPDKETAKYAAVYLQYITPGIPAYILFECGKRFLQAQGIYHISTYVLLFAAPSNLLMNIFFVNQLGYLGAPMAVAINYWLMAIGLYICTVYFVKAEDTPSQLHPLICWGGIDIKGAFKAWDKLIYLAIPGLIMLEAEFLAFEILTLMASYLGTIELAAQSIGSTMASLTYQVPFAIGIASSTRIANFLGAGLGEAAKKSTQVALSFGLLISVLNFSALYFFQTPIAKLFTNDEVVISTVKKIMWLIALMQISDAMNANSAGCLRGQGQTKIGGIVNLFSYYVVGIPLSIYLSFYSKWKGSLHGLWIGSTVALTIIGVVQSYYALFANFDKLCDEAHKRTSSPAGHV